MTDPTPPAVSNAMREAVAPYIALFDVAYRKACEGSMEPDWCNAALLGQQMRNAFFKAIGPDGPIASEIARLTGERDTARTEGVIAWLLEYGQDTYADFTTRIQAAEAETARLRAALEEIAKGAPETEPHPWDGELDTVCWNTAQIARAALSSQEQADV